MNNGQWPVTMLTFAAIFVMWAIAECAGLQ
jgi:hypothetical protein